MKGKFPVKHKPTVHLHHNEHFLYPFCTSIPYDLKKKYSKLIYRDRSEDLLFLQDHPSTHVE